LYDDDGLLTPETMLRPARQQFRSRTVVLRNSELVTRRLLRYTEVGSHYTIARGKIEQRVSTSSPKPSHASSLDLPPDACRIHSEVLRSEVHSVEAAVGGTMAALHAEGCGEAQCAAIELALREALANAMLHGNGGDPQKRVELDCVGHPDGSVTVLVRDQGAGFRLEDVRDPTHPDNVYLTGGRGIYLIRHFMDDVQFRKNGSEIRMMKKK